MRRADRLFRIVGLLRRRRITTAAQLAERLEVSERTIYRDIADLIASGTPIQGEAGVGYRLGKEFDLPPMMFTLDEVHALVLGARMVETWADDSLRMAAQSVIDKVHAVIPARERLAVDSTALFTLSFRVSDVARKHMLVVRQAIHDRHKLEVRYAAETGVLTERRICPLGLFFWGPTWTLGAWCELRRGHRSFRLDRIEAVTRCGDAFPDRDPTTLRAYVAVAKRDRSREV